MIDALQNETWSDSAQQQANDNNIAYIVPGEGGGVIYDNRIIMYVPSLKDQLTFKP